MWFEIAGGAMLGALVTFSALHVQFAQRLTRVETKLETLIVVTRRNGGA